MKSSLRANYTRIIMWMEIQLASQHIREASVSPIADGWRLDMAAGEHKTYRLAQLDDYSGRRRDRFPQTPPFILRLRARLSSPDIPGTWGFGVWNDPMGFSLGFGGKPGRLPALPQAAWFMHASLPNWLSFQDVPTPPANGFFAGTYRSPNISSLLFTPALLALPLFEIRPISRWLRRLAGRMIHQDGAAVDVDVTQWHEYAIAWLDKGCFFTVDGKEVLVTKLAPRAPLGLVIWIDNQFAALTQEGRLGYGTLENQAAWMEIEKLSVTRE
jgi:hypothetical protein